MLLPAEHDIINKCKQLLCQIHLLASILGWVTVVGVGEIDIVE